MERDEVIKMRDALKAGMNIPLIIYIDNTFRIIDESNTFQFTKWDDENSMLFCYTLTDSNMNRPNDPVNTVSLFSVHYTSIQCMEAPRINIKYLPKSIDSLIAQGVTITPEWKQNIIERFGVVFNNRSAEISARDIIKSHGVIDGHKPVNDNDDYYAGRYTQNFQETRSVAFNNEYVDSLKK